MCRNKTMCNMQCLIMLQNLCCINRNYLIHCKKSKRIGDIIFAVSFLSVSAVVIYDFTRVFSLNPFLVIFQFVIGFEGCYLSIVARVHTSLYVAFDNLDDKCDYSDEYFARLRRKVRDLTLMVIMTIVIDIVGMYSIGLSPTTILIITMAFTAHLTEMALCSLLIDSINLRLASLENAHPSYGTRVYRHVLATTTYIKEEMNVRLIIMMSMTLFASVTYAAIIFLAYGGVLNMILYLTWRECNTMYALCLVCGAAGRTEKICTRLALHLAKRLIFDFHSEDRSLLQKITQRWYMAVRCHRPQYAHGTAFPIDLTVPLKLLDLCCNYLLIMLQVYVFYKENY